MMTANLFELPVTFLLFTISGLLSLLVSGFLVHKFLLHRDYDVVLTSVQCLSLHLVYLKICTPYLCSSQTIFAIKKWLIYLPQVFQKQQIMTYQCYAAAATGHQSCYTCTLKSQETSLILKHSLLDPSLVEDIPPHIGSSFPETYLGRPGLPVLSTDRQKILSFCFSLSKTDA